MPLPLEQAKELLEQCTRNELQDHAFGDSEVFWDKDGIEVADGYFGGGRDPVVGIHNPDATFTGKDALALRNCGERGQVERNDSTGPDRYQEGSCLPGLTLEGVRRELTGE